MLAALGLLAAGAAVLYVGAEGAVRGAAGLTRAAGIPAFALGALLFGIDLEGLGAAVVAAHRGETSLAAGEIFGTVMFLFGAAFGAALLLSRRPVPSPEPLMVLSPSLHLVAAAVVVSDRFVSRIEGSLLMVLYAAYVALVARRGRLVPDRGLAEGEEGRRSRAVLALFTLGGLGLLTVGAAIMVAGGARLVGETDLVAGYVGAAVLGALVSLDEVLLEVLPVRRGTPELATGNLLGSLAAFSSGVLGLAALVRPLNVDSGATAAFIGSAFLYAVVATVFLVRGRAGRSVGAIVLTSYAAWLFVVSGV